MAQRSGGDAEYDPVNGNVDAAVRYLRKAAQEFRSVAMHANQEADRLERVAYGTADDVSAGRPRCADKSPAGLACSLGSGHRGVHMVIDQDGALLAPIWRTP